MPFQIATENFLIDTFPKTVYKNCMSVGMDTNVMDYVLSVYSDNPVPLEIQSKLQSQVSSAEQVRCTSKSTLTTTGSP